MAQTQLFDIDTVGYGDKELGSFFDFYVNNVFYLYAPEYYYQFYAIYLNRCLSIYDGWIGGWHDTRSGLVPQRLLQSVTTGLANLLFFYFIDFTGKPNDYTFAKKWAKKSRFYNALKIGFKHAVAGGTSLLKINRKNHELFVTAHRIDTFFADIDATGKVVSVRVYFDAVHNTNSKTGEKHYGLCEERFFDENGLPYVKTAIYVVDGSIQTSVASRPKSPDYDRPVNWQELPSAVKTYIKKNYPDLIIGEPIRLPFYNTLGCFLLRFTENIPQIPNTPFGQPIGDILFTESFQFDQMKYFEKNEVYLARARALLPEEMWNKDDPNYGMDALSERFYQKVSSLTSDTDKITQIQFQLRGQDMRTQKENIYRDIAAKLNLSASTVATFLNEGQGDANATKIIEEKTKTDTWISGEILLNKDEIDDMLRQILYFYGKNPVEIKFLSEDQVPYLDKLKTNSDVMSVGNMSPERFVKDTYRNLTQEEQEKEIEYIKSNREQKEAVETQYGPVPYENATAPDGIDGPQLPVTAATE